MKTSPGQISRHFARGAAALLIIATAFFAVVRAGENEKPELPSKPPIHLPDFSCYGRGRTVYESRCMICHGVAGDGKGEMSASLPVKPRSFRQGIFKYRTTPPGKLPTDDDLKRTVTGGINGTAMGMFTMLSDEEVKAVTEYVKFFSRRWRKPENYALPIQFPAEPAWLRDATALKEHASRGSVLFKTACAACHGETGDGKGFVAGMLKDEWGSAVTPSNLHQQHLRCGSALSDVYRVLSLGIDGTPMPAFDSYTPQQRWDIVAYISTLRPK